MDAPFRHSAPGGSWHRTWVCRGGTVAGPCGQSGGFDCRLADMQLPFSTLSKLAVAAVASGAILASACTPAAAPATSAGTAASGEPIKIGYVWGITGAVADIVRPASEATHAYFDDLNRHGGIN